MLKLDRKTIQVQKDLVEYCRTGEYREVPGANEDRLNHYRRLVSNIIFDSLETAYPLTYNLLKSTEWTELVHQFFSHHTCENPQVMLMPKDLIDYTKSSHLHLVEKYPHLLDLMRFEWVESYMFIMEDQPVDSYTKGDLFSNSLVLNPEMKIEKFEFPVHLKVAQEITSSDCAEYFCLAYRDLKTGTIHFLNVTPLLVVLLENIILGYPVNEVVEALVEITNQSYSDLNQSVSDFINLAYQKGIILGVKK